MPTPPTRLDPPFDAIDHRRLARHQELLKIWQGLSAEELLADLQVLTQFVAFKHRQEVLTARAARKAESGS